jgi:hypothetical protein
MKKIPHWRVLLRFPEQEFPSKTEMHPTERNDSR